MKESSGDDYIAAKYEKGTYLAPGKVGKTCFLVASALGVLPNQMAKGSGGIVGSPSKLHVIAIDSSAVTGVVPFMLNILGAPKEVGRIRVYNMQSDVNAIGAGQNEYDLGFYNAYLATLGLIQQKVASEGGTHAVIVSSLTGLSTVIERGIAGPPGSAGVKNRDGEISGKGYMDPSKWKSHAQAMSQIRFETQKDSYHCLWEGHIDVVKAFAMKADEAGSKEVIAISGATGRNWVFNTDHTFRLRRQFGDTWDGTECDKIHLCAPDMDFSAGGRGYTGVLKPKEWDLTSVYKRLGLQVGGWGARKVKGKKASH